MSEIAAPLAVLVALVVALVVALPLGGAVKKHPGVFYLVAAVLSAAYLYAFCTGVSMAAIRPLALVMQKGLLGCMLLAIVMFTGVFAEGSAPRKKLQPIRGELSILSAIFLVAHVGTYLPSYLPRLGIVLGSKTTVGLSLLVSLVLTVLFAVLAVTSIKALRRAMNPRLWKAIQCGSYVLVALLLLHVWLILGKSALSGGADAIATFVGYALVVGVYAVLRIRKAVADARRKAGRA
jgi:DMSO/TMAO reductase YedYZ heme-binding membrane subunit